MGLLSAGVCVCVCERVRACVYQWALGGYVVIWSPSFSLIFCNRAHALRPIEYSMNTTRVWLLDSVPSKRLPLH